MEKLFAVTAPGLGIVTAKELTNLGLTTAPQEPDISSSSEEGGIEFSGVFTDIYRTNLSLRTASRVLVRLGNFYAASFSELRKRASRLPWEKFIRPGQRVSIRVTCHKSRLYHSGAVAERIAGAISDKLGKPPIVEKFDELAEKFLPQLVIVRLVNDQVAISIDSSGALLHRRGYRQAVGKAPLRETLAAGILIASGWDGSSPLIDPFCGSGTIPIEAALLARNIAPGRNRRFAFMDWPGYDQATWKAILSEAKEKERESQTIIKGSDRDAGVIQMARDNAERAGMASHIDFSCQAVSAIEPPTTSGWIITNPPYGIRVSMNKDLRNLYAQFGNVLRVKCPGWHTAILCSDNQLLGQTRIHLDPVLSLINGGIQVRLVKGNVPFQESSK